MSQLTFQFDPAAQVLDTDLCDRKPETRAALCRCSRFVHSEEALENSVSTLSCNPGTFIDDCYQDTI